MGAANALGAYRRFAGKVPPNSLACLVYMALVGLDADAWPWFSQGQEALAEHALGRPNPTASDLRAVQRALAPLLAEGAITVDRAGAARTDGNTSARYRLNVHDRADTARAAWAETSDGNRRMSDRRTRATHTTVSDEDTRRFPTTHTTVSDETPDGNRRPKEYEEYEELEDQEEHSRSSTAVTLTPAPGREEPDLISSPEGSESPALRLVGGNMGAPMPSRTARPLLPAAMPKPSRWSTRASEEIAAASARRAAARAATASDSATAG